MLSRMLSARSLTRSARSLAMPQLRMTRSFMSSPALKNVAAPVAVKAEEHGDVADLINKYGKSTFWGMFAAILVSKEVFILDA